MGCFSGHLISAASDQKLFCKLCSLFCCSLDEFVEEKAISPSYSSAILTCLYPLKHKRPIGIVTEAVWPVGGRRVHDGGPTPLLKDWLLCGRVCQAPSAQAHFGWFLCFEVWPLRPGSSSGRLVLRLTVSFQSAQLVCGLHQTVTVLPECIVGPPVPFWQELLCGEYCIIQGKTV